MKAATIGGAAGDKMASDDSLPSPSPPKSRPWYRSPATVVITILSLIAIGGAFAAFEIYAHCMEVVLDAYAQQSIAGTVITHMDLNDGHWPSSWNDLGEAFETHAAAGSRPWRFDDLRRRVEVDFSADPAKLAKAEMTDKKRPFRVIFLRSGKEGHYWQGAEPNFLVWEYLQERAKRPPTYKPPARPDPREKQARKALFDLGATWQLDDVGRLKEVDLNWPQHTDADLVHLRGLNDLQGLNLADSNVGDPGLESIRDLNHLKWIYLYRTKVTDAGLKHLEKMPQLTMLVLADQKFTDAAFDSIVRLPSLLTLNLNGTRVTDGGITRLYDLKNLQNVMLYNTAVTSEGIRKLRAALPGCKVEN